MRRRLAILSVLLATLLIWSAAEEGFAGASVEKSRPSIGAWAGEGEGGTAPHATYPDPKTDDNLPFAQEEPTNGSSQQGEAGGDGQNEQPQPTVSVDPAKVPNKANAAGMAQAQKAPRGSPSLIHTAAAQILQSLDVAIGVAQKSGTIAASASASKSVSDISTRRDALQQRAKMAGNDAAWADVANGGAGLLAETLALIPASPGNATARVATQPADSRTGVQDSFRSSQLPLYVAGLSLIVSIVSLGGGWLLARRQVNKALVEAGLL